MCIKIIDINLALAQVFNALIDGLVGGQQAGASGKELTTMAGLVGQSGPAMLVSVLAIMAEISITLAIMLAPLFIFFLLFQQTSAMFWTWVKFLLGTMVSLAVLALLSGILLKMMMFYGATVLGAFYLNAAAAGLVSVDIGGSAMRMASMGALASALIMLVPPLIMQFFNSGASFAAGAMMGMVGGGAAGGAMGLAKQLGNQGEGGSAGGQGANGAMGAQGTPGSIGYNGGESNSGCGQQPGAPDPRQQHGRHGGLRRRCWWFDQLCGERARFAWIGQQVVGKPQPLQPARTAEQPGVSKCHAPQWLRLSRGDGGGSSGGARSGRGDSTLSVKTRRSWKKTGHWARAAISVLVTMGGPSVARPH